MVIVVLIVVIALLVHGCQVSQTKSSLEDYTGQVYSIIGRSNATGKQLFSDLDGASNDNQIQTKLNDLHKAAGNQLNDAEDLSVPGAMAKAQQYVVQTLQQRADGVKLVAANIQQALNSSSSADGVRKIATGTSYMYSSDVIYKGYAAPAIASALNDSSIAVTSTTINSGQFVPDLGWLQQTFIAAKIGAQLPSSEVNNKPVPGGLYGHELDTVSVGGTALTEGITNTIPGSEAPKFQLNFTNSGDYTERDVVCKVKLTGANTVSATSTVAQTLSKQAASCTVQLPKSVTGTYTVVADVEKVPGETNTSNNSQTFTIDFTG